jgi:histidine triad (HIT) family protein
MRSTDADPAGANPYHRRMADCLFCRIVAGEVPSESVRSTGSTYAFRDVTPQAPVHVLLVPRDHYDNAAELANAAPAVMAELMREAGAVAADLGVADSGYRMVFNTGAEANQTVNHAHLHLLAGRPMGWPPG